MTGTSPSPNARATRTRRAGAIGLVLSLACIAAPARGGDAQASPAPVAYRRVFVPADNVPVWPRDGRKYLPVEVRELDAWIAAANRSAAGGAAAARIVDAQYSARLEGNQLVDGQASWDIELRGDEPALLPLAHMALVVREPAWRDEPALSAQLGVWGDRRGTYGLQVPRSGTLTFAWHAFPVDETSGTLEFPLRLPPAARQRLTVDLPADKRPALDGSVVVDSAILATENATATTSWRRWILAVAESSTNRLRIEELRSEPATARPTTTLHENLTYRIDQRGLEVVARLNLDSAERELRRLTVKLPPGLHLLSALVGDRELSWRVVADPLSGGTRALIRLAPLPSDGRISVTLRAWEPLVSDQLLTLPTLRPEGVFWSSGSMKVAIDPLIELRDLATTDCVQTGVVPASPSGPAPTTLRFAAYSPAASLAVMVGNQQPIVSARQGTTLEIGDVGITGRLVTRLEVDRGSLHALAAELQPGWAVDSVVTDPVGALADWYVERVDGRPTLRLQFAAAVTPAHPVAVVATGHLQRSIAAKPIAAHTLSMLRWQDVSVARHLLLLQTNEPRELASPGQLPPVAEEDLESGDRQLFGDAMIGQVVDLRAAAADASVRLAATRGTFDATIQLDATLESGALRQRWQIVCQPHGAGVERLLVYVSQPLGDNVAWQEETSHERLVAERVSQDDPQWKQLPDEGELWELRLRHPSLRPVTIEATVTARWPEGRAVPLVALPDAASQQARILVRTVGEGGVELDGRGLTPVPLPVESADERSDIAAATVCAAFRYDPSQFVRGNARPQLRLGPDSGPHAGADLFASQVEIDSIYAVDGQASHRVTYQLQHGGAPRIDLRLPPGARLDSAHVDDRPTSWQEADENRDQLSFVLPTDKRLCELKLEFRTSASPLAQGRVLSPPLPDGSVPLLAGRWTVWLPEHFTADRTSTEKESGGLEHPSPVPPGGWQAYETTFVAAPPRPIRVAHAPTTTAWTMAIFLVAAMGGTWLERRPATYFIVLAAAAAALGMLLPVSLAPLATGALLGLLFSLVIRWTVRGRTRRRSDTTWTRPHRLPAAATTSVGLLLLVVGLVSAQPTANSDTTAGQITQPTESTIHTVLVPVDAAGRPAGTKHYVSEQFLRELLAYGTESGSAGDWLLRDATYSGELKQLPDQSAIVPGNWNMTLDVEVLARDTAIELPLVRAEAAWAPTASLDGIPIALVWHKDGRGCSIAVAEPGRYQLSLAFEPRVSAVADRAELRLAIPRLTGAKFQLACPVQLTDCRVPGHNVVRTAGAAADLLAGELGTDDQLIVSWPQRKEPSDRAVRPQVAELLWLQIDRDGVELNAKYLLGAGENPVQEFSIAADEGWELLTDATAASVRSIDVEPGEMQTIRVRLSGAATDGREVLLRFRLRGGRALGRHRFPEIDLASPTAASRWLAVGSDPSLECEAALDAARATAEEFVSVWGDAAEAPQMVFANIRDLGSWDMAVRPRTGTSTIDEMLHVAAGRETLRLQYEAEVEPTGDRCYRYELTVPASLSVSTIAVHEADHDVPFYSPQASRRGDRQSVDAGPNRRVTVFFDRPVERPYRIVLSGSVPIGDSGQCAVPRLVAASAEPSTQQIVLYREADVDVQLRGAAQTDLSLEQPDEIPPIDWAARQVGVYQLDRQAAETARIVISAQQPVDVAEPVPTPSDEQASNGPSLAAATDDAPRSTTERTADESPSVRFVDTTGLVDAAGGQILVSRFVLAPRGLRQCVLRLPEGQQLVRVELDDRPALLQPQGPNQWQVSLGPPNLPQLLEVTTRTADTIPTERGTIELLRPTLLALGKPISVELSLWSLCYQPNDGVPSVNDVAVVTAEELNALRLERLVGVAETATESVRLLPASDGRNWLLQWTRRLSAVRADGHSGLAWPDEPAPSSQVPQLADRQLAEAANRMDLWLEQVQDLFADRAFEGKLKSSAAPTLVDRWPGAADGRWVYCIAAGGTERLRLQLPPVAAASGPIRAGGLLAVLCVAGAAVWLVNRPAACDPLWRWPHTVGVLFGLACWAWLSPAWIGLLIAGGSLILLVRRGWPARSVYAEGPTVLHDHTRS